MEQVAVLVMLEQFWALLNQFDISLIYISYKESVSGKMARF